MDPAGERNAGAASNQYQILGHLATGGMAELYLARAVGIAGFERYVVLKRIMAEHARNHRFVTMFLDEARLAAQLHHTNIAQVYDIGRVGDSYFFTMEYVHGENVRDLLQRVAALKRQIPIEITLSIIAGAAAGLHYAHDKRGINRQPLGIVHRDVSPSNLMVAYEGAVKLVDFGIAKASHRMTETRSGAVKGKVAYMSPEQCTGHQLDRRSDVFSLGIVLFEMATMSRLFKHTTDFETMTHIVNHPVPAPSSRRPDLPRELEQIILRALAKKPEDRFPTAGEMLEAIEQFAARERLALSNTGLARYVRELFGERPEPWYELEAAGENTGLVTIETAALGPASFVEPDPFAPNSTQRSWSGAAPRMSAREWQSSGPSSTDGAFAENAATTAPYAAPPDTVRAAMPPQPRPRPRPPTASVPVVVPAPVLAMPSDVPRKPSTNPAAAPPPPPRITGPQPAITGPIATPRTTLTGTAPPPVSGQMARVSASMIAPVSMSAPMPAVAPPLDESRSETGTVIGAPSTAPLVVQEPEVVRDTPDHDPSWGGERDPSWRGHSAELEFEPAPQSRRWIIWGSLIAALVLGGTLFFLTSSGDSGAAAARAPVPAAGTAGAGAATTTAPTPTPTPTIDPAAGSAVVAEPGAGSGSAEVVAAPGAGSAGAEVVADPGAGSGSAEVAVEPGAGSGSAVEPTPTPTPSTDPARTGRRTPPTGRRTTPPKIKPKTGSGAPPPPRKCGDALGLYPPCE